jgi:D-sedoheptulose 7-phosphate isomerase
MSNSEGNLVSEIARDYLQRLKASIDAVSIVEIELAHQAILQTRLNNGTLWICGNGGSSATASHMQVDLSFGVKPAVRARSMSDNSAALTATGNDVDYDHVFSRQLEIEGAGRDMLIVISASGNSANLLNAVEAASKIGMTTCAFVGFDGGKLKGLVEIAVHTPTRQGDYGVAEDLHASLNHILKEMLNGFWGNGKPDS